MQEPLGYKHLLYIPNQHSMQPPCPWKVPASMVDRQVGPCMVLTLAATDLEAFLPPHLCTARGVDRIKALVNVNNNGDRIIPRSLPCPSLTQTLIQARPTLASRTRLGMAVSKTWRHCRLGNRRLCLQHPQCVRPRKRHTVVTRFYSQEVVGNLQSQCMKKTTARMSSLHGALCYLINTNTLHGQACMLKSLL